MLNAGYGGNAGNFACKRKKFGTERPLNYFVKSLHLGAARAEVVEVAADDAGSELRVLYPAVLAVV